MVARPNGSVSSTFPTTPTHPRLQTTLSSAGCRRIVHFIDYLTDYLLGQNTDRRLPQCHATRHFPLLSTSCMMGVVWLGLERHKLCIGIIANECYVQRIYAWYGDVNLSFPQMRQVIREQPGIQESRRSSQAPEKRSR